MITKSKVSKIETTTYKASSNHLYSEIAEEAVILELNSGVYYGLNEVGVDIWKWLQQPQTEERILNLLLAEYEVTSEQAREDLQSVLAQLLEAGLIEIVE